jgi:hypothetical protein
VDEALLASAAAAAARPLPSWWSRDQVEVQPVLGGLPSGTIRKVAVLPDGSRMATPVSSASYSSNERRDQKPPGVRS